MEIKKPVIVAWSEKTILTEDGFYYRNDVVEQLVKNVLNMRKETDHDNVQEG